jgi:hypothetical protein
MLTAMNKAACKVMLPASSDVEAMQRLRFRRFGMSLVTYALVILVTFVVTHLGLGKMSSLQWAVYIGAALFGNAVFFVLFRTNANLRFADASLTREQIVYSGLWGMVALYSLPEARPIVLMFYLPAFSFGMLRLTRQQYFGAVAWVLGFYAMLLCLEYFQARQGFKIRYELFLFALFGVLLAWFAFFGGFVTNIRRRLRAQAEEIKKAHEEIRIEMENRKRAQIEKDNLIVELQEALGKVTTLSGMLPICASCKKIRDDNGYWNQIEAYITMHSDAAFSHGLCEDCARKLYPDLYPDEET